LPTERRTRQSVPQLAPKDVLLIRHSSTKSTCEKHCFDSAGRVTHARSGGRNRACGKRPVEEVATRNNDEKRSQQSPPRFGEGQGWGTGFHDLARQHNPRT
jgi:hypothetical protein